MVGSGAGHLLRACLATSWLCDLGQQPPLSLGLISSETGTIIVVSGEDAVR